MDEKSGGWSGCIAGSSLGQFLAIALLFWGPAACEPLPFHLDPLSVNGRDGGGSPPSYQTLMGIAAAAQASGDYANALSTYRRAAEIEPRFAAAFVGIGDALLAAGKVNEAILAYNSALARDGSSLAAERGLARAYLKTGRPELAAIPLSRALAQAPDDPKLLMLLGATRDLEGRHEQAQAYYQRGLQRAPGDPALTIDLALSFALSGNYVNAAGVLQPIAAAPGATAQERQTLALIYGLQGRVGEAARLGRVDLDEAAVEQNLAYYQTLRAMPLEARDRAILSAGKSHPAAGSS